jgi:hypothetical protein
VSNRVRNLLAGSIIIALGAAVGFASFQGRLNLAIDRLLFVVLSLLLAVVIVVFFRLYGNVPSELDRIGSDLSLYGYGVGLSFLFSKQLGRTVLEWLPENTFALFIVLALLVTLLVYLITLELSQRIRKLERGRFSDGVESWDELQALLRISAGRRYMSWSLTLGFVPALALVMLDMIP